MTAPGFLVPLVRGFLPAWWVGRVTDAQLASWGRQLRNDWDTAQLFGEIECAPLLVRRIRQLADDVADFAGIEDGAPTYRQADAERAALIQLAAVCLARLAATERSP